MGLPCSVGAAAGISDVVEDGDVALLDEELIELMLFVTNEALISFLGIDLFPVAEGVDSPDSADFRACSPLCLASCGGCGMTVLSDFLGGSGLGAPRGGSLR